MKRSLKNSFRWKTKKHETRFIPFSTQQTGGMYNLHKSGPQLTRVWRLNKESSHHIINNPRIFGMERPTYHQRIARKKQSKLSSLITNDNWLSDWILIFVSHIIVLQIFRDSIDPLHIHFDLYHIPFELSNNIIHVLAHIALINTLFLGILDNYGYEFLNWPE